jgi:hypothetical protein
MFASIIRERLLAGLNDVFGMQYKATERYQFGWHRDAWAGALPVPTWEHCLLCHRETPHLGHCVYTAWHPSGNGIADRMEAYGLDITNPEHVREFSDAMKN